MGMYINLSSIVLYLDIAGNLRDKTMDDKLMYNPNHDKYSSVKTKIIGRKVWTLLV